jgi:signal transduction histidine kinase
MLRTDIDLLTGKETHEILTSLHDLSKSHLKLLDNLLQWARVQTGRMEANPDIFNLVKIIDQVVGFYNVTAFEKQVNLVSTAEGEIMVFADKNMIRTVLRNLVSNALKYTAMEGVVVLGAKLLPDKIEVTVKDNGLGMAPEMVAKLFNLDQTFSTVGTANEQGTGLGLILCKEFIEKNRGTISVESVHGHGSTFRFTLPLSE